jgi:hypothetical protein
MPRKLHGSLQCFGDLLNVRLGDDLHCRHSLLMGCPSVFAEASWWLRSHGPNTVGAWESLTFPIEYFHGSRRHGHPL